MNKFIKTGLAISLIASSLFMLNGCSQKEEEVLVAEEAIELPEIIEKIEEVEVAEAEVKERIINLLSDKLGYDKTEIKEGQNFVTDLGADSLDMVEVCALLP